MTSNVKNEVSIVDPILKIAEISPPEKLVNKFLNNINECALENFYDNPVKENLFLRQTYLKLYSIGILSGRDNKKESFFDRKIQNSESLYALVSIITETQKLFDCLYDDDRAYRYFMVSKEILQRTSNVFYYVVYMLSALKEKSISLTSIKYKSKELLEKDIHNIYEDYRNVLYTTKKSLNTIKEEFFLKSSDKEFISYSPSWFYNGLFLLCKDVNHLYDSYMEDNRTKIFHDSKSILYSLTCLSFSFNTSLEKIVEEFLK